MNGQKQGFRKDVQGLRAIAVLLVLAYHAGIESFHGGFLGVDVFFVVSGFVIGRNLFREIDSSNTISLRKFYERRIRRILPPLALVLVVTVLGALIFQSPLDGASDTVQTALATSAFSANFRFAFDSIGYFDASPISNPLLHMWSLSVEEQFYFVAPALLLFGLFIASKREKANRHRTLVWLLVAFGLVSLVVCLAATSRVSIFASITRSPTLAFYGSPFRAWEFVVGLLLASLEPHLSKLPGRAAAAGAAASGGALAYAVMTTDPAKVWPSAFTIVPVLATAGIIGFGGAGSPGPVSRLLATTPAVWIGNISYPLYLWHYPFVVFAANLWPSRPGVKLVATLLAFIPAWLSDRYVEQPILQRRRLPSTPVVFAVCLALPVLASGVTHFGVKRLASSERFDAIIAAGKDHADYARGCDESMGPWDRARCSWVRAEGSADSIHLVGDSMAGALSEGVLAAAERTNANVVMQTMSACPFLDVRIDKGGVTDKKCVEHNSRVLAELRSTPPRIVTVSFAIQGYLAFDHYRFVDRDGRVADTKEERMTMMTESLLRIATEMKSLGVELVFVEPPSTFRIGRVIDCPTIRVLASSSCELNLTASQYDKDLRDSRAVLSNTQPGVHVVSVAGVFCSNSERCSSRAGTVQLLRDDNHLSVEGSRRSAELLISEFSKFLTGV